jgi:hypothetical protein
MTEIALQALDKRGVMSAKLDLHILFIRPRAKVGHA